MEVDVQAEALISRPRAEVAAYVMDPSNDRAWIQGILEVEALTPRPVGVGTRVRRVASFMGRRFEYILEVEELVPDALLVMRTSVPFDMNVTYAFADRDGSTLASVRVQGEPSAIYKVAGPFLKGMVKQSITRDIRALKAALERREPSGPS